MMSRRLNWDRDGRNWPNRESSRFVTASGLRWHVQVMGAGPLMLLLHGTGASTHSFRALGSLLARQFTVVAPDLPGHGFTSTPASSSGYALPNVARGIAGLLDELLGDELPVKASPIIVVGHSAGAAVAVRMCLDHAVAPAAVVSLNGALLPFPGMSNDFLGPVARFLASSGAAAQAVAFFAGSRPSVGRLIRSTGSRIDAEGARLYERLVSDPGHVRGALGLMANWDLRPLVRDLPKLGTRLVLVTGSNDGMVPAAEAYRVRSLIPTAEIVSMRGLGHLAHEERPQEVAALLQRVAASEAAA